MTTLTLEEVQAIFDNASVTPGERGGSPSYTYYVPHGAGVIDAGKIVDMMPFIEGMIFAGYNTNNEPMFAPPNPGLPS